MHHPASLDGHHVNEVSRQASLADLNAIVPAYGAAVCDEAVMSWMLPDEDRRRRLAEIPGFGRYVHELLETSVLVVAAIDGIAGVSVWLRVDGASAEEAAEPTDADEQALLREVYGEHVDRVRQVGALTAQCRPLGQTYFYLQQMAVLPAYRGRGLGGSMLRYGLAVADVESLPVYLEASTPRNRSLYARHGFVDVGAPIELPEEGPRLQPMCRAFS